MINDVRTKGLGGRRSINLCLCACEYRIIHIREDDGAVIDDTQTVKRERVRNRAKANNCVCVWVGGTRSRQFGAQGFGQKFHSSKTARAVGLVTYLTYALERIS